jgi:hypothetical protein
VEEERLHRKQKMAGARSGSSAASVLGGRWRARHRPGPAAFAIHSAVHAARPDVIAAAHAHSVYGKAWSAPGRLLDPSTQDACVFYEDDTVCNESGGAIVLEEAAAKARAAAQGDDPPQPRVVDSRAVGHSVDEAAWCYTRDHTASHGVGWFSFQPIWDEISPASPSCSNNPPSSHAGIFEQTEFLEVIGWRGTRRGRESQQRVRFILS